MENLANDKKTELQAGVLAGATTITIKNSTGWPAPNFRIRIDDELMLVTNKGAGTELTWTVVRGIEGTEAVAHLVDADVYQVLTAGGLEKYLTDRLGGGSVIANTSRDLTVSDINKTLMSNSASATTFTIQNDATAGWPDDAFISSCQLGTGAPSFAAVSGVIIRNPNSLTSSRYGYRAIHRVGANEWIML